MERWCSSCAGVMVCIKISSAERLANWVKAMSSVSVEVSSLAQLPWRRWTKLVAMVSDADALEMNWRREVLRFSGSDSERSIREWNTTGPCQPMDCKVANC